MSSQNTSNAKRFYSVQGNSRPEKTEGAVVRIPSSRPLSVVAHQLLILDVGGVVPVTLFQLNGVHSHLSPLRELSDAWLLGAWGVGMFFSLTERQKLYGKRSRRSPVGEESVHAERGDTSSGFCCYDVCIIPACIAFCWQNYLFLLSLDCLV